jgi:hypothetical protein
MVTTYVHTYIVPVKTRPAIGLERPHLYEIRTSAGGGRGIGHGCNTP